MPHAGKRRWRPDRRTHAIMVPGSICSTFCRYHGVTNPGPQIRAALVEIQVRMEMEMAAYEGRQYIAAGQTPVHAVVSAPPVTVATPPRMAPKPAVKTVSASHHRPTRSTSAGRGNGHVPPTNAVTEEFPDLDLTDVIISDMGYFHRPPIVEPNDRSYQCMVCMVNDPDCRRLAPGEGKFVLLTSYEGKLLPRTACLHHARTINEIYRRTILQR